MAESSPSNSALTALSGTTDAATGVGYPTIAQSPYYLAVFLMLYRLLDVARRAGDLRVYKDDSGELKFAVRSGEFLDGDEPVSYEGAEAQDLTDDAVNTIYLLADGTLTVSTEGFPVPSVTPHIPLATIATGSESAGGISGQYDFADITDYRGRSFLRVVGKSEHVSIHNAGDEEKTYETLPPAAPGARRTYFNLTAYGMRITAPAGVAIRQGDQVSPAAGYVETAQNGANVTLELVTATEWHATAWSGTWTVSE